MGQFYSENQITGKNEKIANEAVGLIHRLCEITCGALEETPVKIAFTGGAAMVPTAMISMNMAGKRGGRDPDTFSPTMDEILFGAYYMISALEEHPQGIIAGFSLEAVNDALRIFRERHGRDYTNIHPALMKMVEEWRTRAGKVPDNIKQFLPD